MLSLFVAVAAAVPAWGSRLVVGMGGLHELGELGSLGKDKIRYISYNFGINTILTAVG